MIEPPNKTRVTALYSQEKILIASYQREKLALYLSKAFLLLSWK
ncbi:hypothetical protein N480_25790 [Pseudoalteromonas luteoviolacea S2607]|nr:hypothetical protein N480_25790 [Pseudoalteromonas luteoviolacea S2607]